jgi:hypothetical protein
VYIDHVIYFNRITTVNNPIRAYNTIRITCPGTRLFHVPFKWYKQIEITRSIVIRDNRALTSSISINKLSYVVIKTLLIVLIGD